MAARCCTAPNADDGLKYAIAFAMVKVLPWFGHRSTWRVGIADSFHKAMAHNLIAVLNRTEQKNGGSALESWLQSLVCLPAQKAQDGAGISIMALRWGSDHHASG